MNTEAGEGAAAHYVQQTTFGKTYIARNVTLAISLVIALAYCVWNPTGWIAGSFAVLFAGALITALVAGRALFYVLVIPTTMPGAFFWKNKGFEQHAKDIGLADMPQVGVVPHAH